MTSISSEAGVADLRRIVQTVAILISFRALSEMDNKFALSNGAA
jgi:hypothetical protein